MEQQQKIFEILRSGWKLVVMIMAVFLLLAIFLFLSFRVPDRNASAERFVISIGENRTQIANDLKNQGFIKNTFVFNFDSIFFGNINPGGYKISKSQNVWQIAGVLSKNPYMKWVVIPEGLRKEETAALIGKTLGWTSGGREEFINYAGPSSDYFEGVYFPDTYLIPVDEAPSDTAKKLIGKFQENFAPLSKAALDKNIKWTTALKIASIIQREAAGKNDMALISGIIWNRLDKKMELDMDSTLQYVRGDAGKGFWAPITVADKKTDSLYNTYLHTGLPPHPISNPGLSAIDAAVNPEQTDCFYYLHDNSEVIHCSETYAEQQQNVSKYLK
jgi:UPF0755 protein